MRQKVLLAGPSLRDWSSKAGFLTKTKLLFYVVSHVAFCGGCCFQKPGHGHIICLSAFITCQVPQGCGIPSSSLTHTRARRTLLRSERCCSMFRVPQQHQSSQTCYLRLFSPRMQQLEFLEGLLSTLRRLDAKMQDAPLHEEPMPPLTDQPEAASTTSTPPQCGVC